MKLERFNQFGKYIEFDSEHGRVVEILALGRDESLRGVADILDGSFVAVVGINNGLILYVNGAAFDLMNPSVELTYEHKDNGTTIFVARDATKSEKIVYNTWWRTGTGVAAFGASEDEDEDICAYIIFMKDAPSRKAHLIRKYN